MNTRTFITGSIAPGAGAVRAIAVPLAATAHVEVTQNKAADGSHANVTVDTTMVSEAVTRVIWMAHPGSEIKEDEICQSTLSVGAVPHPGKITLDVLQTASNGPVVEWIGTAEKAAHLFPVLNVNDKPAANPDADAITTSVAGPDSDTTTASSTASGDPHARVLGIGGLAVRAVGVVLSIVTLRRSVTG